MDFGGALVFEVVDFGGGMAEDVGGFFEVGLEIGGAVGGGEGLEFEFGGGVEGVHRRLVGGERAGGGEGGWRGVA